MERIFPEFRHIHDPLSIYDALDWPVAPPDRPMVAVNMVSSVDGKITVNRKLKKGALGSEVDRVLMRRLRVHFDAVARGASTVRANPYFPAIADGFVDQRLEAGMSEQPLAVTFSNSLDLPFETAFFAEASSPPIVFAPATASDARRQAAKAFARVEIAGRDRVDVEAALRVLFNRYGVRRLLLEGGAALNYWFARADLIDVYFWTLAPKLSGFRDDLTMIEGAAPLQPTPRLYLDSLHHHEGELFFRWRSKA